MDYLIADEEGIEVNTEMNNWPRKVLKQVVVMEGQHFVVSFWYQLLYT